MNAEGEALPFVQRWSISPRMLPVASPVMLRAPMALAKRTAFSVVGRSLMRGGVRNALDAAVELCVERNRDSSGLLGEEHELAARHLDLLDAQTFQLDDHVVDGEVVIVVGPDADVQRGLRVGRNAGPWRRSRRVLS